MKWFFLLLSAVSIIIASAVSAQDNNNLVELRVPFLYQMDLNATEGVATTIINQGLQVLKKEAGNRMMELLEDSNAAEYTGFESRPYDTACTPEETSDECKIVESDVVLQVPGTTNRVDASFATLEEVQMFVQDFNTKYDNQIHVGYQGPYHFNATFVVHLEPVERKMNDNEIAIFEHVWLTILRSHDDDIEILKVTVVYQECPLCLVEDGDDNDSNNNKRAIRRHRALQRVNAKNTIYVKIDGLCYGCSSDSVLYNDVHDRDVSTTTDQQLTDLETEFEQDVRMAAEDPLESGMDEADPTIYFDKPSATISAVEAPPQAPLDPEQVEDLNDPLYTTSFNWVVLAMLGAAALIVLGGLACVLVNRRKKAIKQLELSQRRDSDADQFVSGRNMRHNNTATAPEQPQQEPVGPPQRSMEEESVDDTMVYTTGNPGVEEQEVYWQQQQQTRFR